LLYVGGFHGRGNLGDDALFAAARKIFAHCSFVEFSGKPAVTPLRLLYPSGQPAILAGGTLINRDPGWLEVVREYSRVGNGLSVFGTGVASRDFWAGRDGWTDQLGEWVPILRACRYVGVRGPLSAQALKAEGIEAEVLGDPALALADESINRISLASPPSLGLSIATKGAMWGDKADIQMKVAELAQKARTNGWDVHWFVLHAADLGPTRELAERTATARHIHQTYTDYREYMNLVRPLTAFVGMKLHAVVLAICAYVPSIMLEYRPKCRDFMLSIGQGDVSFRVDTFDPEETWKIVRGWRTTGAGKSDELYEVVQAARRRLLAKARELVPAR
jgi:polysaccharide pyruvyl transferase WcaK-like protein